MKNEDIRKEAQASGLKLWQIANRLGLADCNFSRKLREELPVSEKTKIRSIIAQLKESVD